MAQQLSLEQAPVLARFLYYVRPDAETGCWDWAGTIVESNGGQYGQFWYKSRHLRAHRFIYESLIGPVPRGLVVDHICENTSCVNPAHLQVLTHRENIAKGRSASAKRTRIAKARLSTDGKPYPLRVTPSRVRSGAPFGFTSFQAPGQRRTDELVRKEGEFPNSKPTGGRAPGLTRPSPAQAGGEAPIRFTWAV